MKRIQFLRRPITYNVKRPHSKAEEPDCLSRRNPPSIMITTWSPRGEGIYLNPVRKVGLCPRLYKELMLSIYNIPGINGGVF